MPLARRASALVLAVVWSQLCRSGIFVEPMNPGNLFEPQRGDIEVEKLYAAPTELRPAGWWRGCYKDNTPTELAAPPCRATGRTANQSWQPTPGLPLVCFRLPLARRGCTLRWPSTRMTRKTQEGSREKAQEAQKTGAPVLRLLAASSFSWPCFTGANQSRQPTPGARLPWA